MSDLHLLISSPPHDENADANVVASAFGKLPAEVRFKTRLALPEIWFGDRDAAKVQGLAATLQQAGYRVFAVPAEQFAATPDAGVVDAFLFHENGVLWDVADTGIEMPSDARVLVVYGRPEQPPGEARRLNIKRRHGSFLGRTVMYMGAGHLGVALYNAHNRHLDTLARNRAARKESAGQKNALPQSAFIDFYLSTSEGVLRLSLIEGTVGYKECLGADAKNTSRDNTLLVLDRVRAQFPNAQINRQLDNVAYRPATMSGLALSALLAGMKTDWKDLDAFDLASRLIYWTRFPPEWAEAPPSAVPDPAQPTSPPPAQPSGALRKSFEG